MNTDAFANPASSRENPLSSGGESSKLPTLTDADLVALSRFSPEYAPRFFARFTEVAVAAAKRTGMLVGWTQLEHGGGHELLYRCLVCRIGHVYWLGGDDRDADRGRVEQLMDLQFAEEAERRGCAHWEAYRVLRGT